MIFHSFENFTSHLHCSIVSKLVVIFLLHSFYLSLFNDTKYCLLNYLFTFNLLKSYWSVIYPNYIIFFYCLICFFFKMYRIENIECWQKYCNMYREGVYHFSPMEGIHVSFNREFAYNETTFISLNYTFSFVIYM